MLAGGATRGAGVASGRVLVVTKRHGTSRSARFFAASSGRRRIARGGDERVARRERLPNAAPGAREKWSGRAARDARDARGGRDERRGRSETLVRVGKPVRSAARCASPRGERGRDWSVPGRASMLRSSSQARACVRPRRIDRLADDRPTACRALIRDLTRQDRVRPAIVSANQISPRNFLAQDASLSSVWPDAWRRAGHCDVARSHPTREFTSRPAGHVTRHREANPGRIQRGETTREVASSARVRGVFG